MFQETESAIYDDPAMLLERAEERALAEYEANADRPAYQAITASEYVKHRVRVMFENGEIE